MRSLSRTLGLDPKQHTADMFDRISAHLNEYEDIHTKHPILVFDNGEKLPKNLLEFIRLLSNFEMDSQDKCSILILGTEDLYTFVSKADNRGFNQCVTYIHKLRSFTLEETKQYFHFHLKRAEGRSDIFTPGVIDLIFHYAKGVPRPINQLATQSLIRASVKGVDQIDEQFFKKHVLPHTFYDAKNQPME